MRAREYESHPLSPAPPLLPEAPAVSWVRIHRAEAKLGAHTHTAYEIVYVVRGRMDNWVGDRLFRIDAGEVFITPPATFHGGVDNVLHPNEHALIHLRFPDKGASLPGLSKTETRALAGEFAAMAPSVFPANATVPQLIKRMLEEYRCPKQPYAELRARAALHELLAVIALDRRRFLADPAAGPAISTGISAAVAWLDDHLGDDIAFDALARRCGMSPTNFRRRFTRELGETPAGWLMRRRVERSRGLLRQGATVTSVAFRLGFSSGQYFATVFKRFTGLTPQAWRTSADDVAT